MSEIAEPSAHVYLLCYNEAPLLPHTIRHYKQYLPTCQITILDNYSTDNSRELARSMGCQVEQFESGDCTNDYTMVSLKNNCWKEAKGWVIVADMDEWLCVTEQQLIQEEKNGVTLIHTKGYNMVGHSQTEDLSDVDLLQLTDGIYCRLYSKWVCFNAGKITGINYNLGAHYCNPTGELKSSKDVYVLKHIAYPGFAYFRKKMLARFERSKSMRAIGMCTHYIDDEDHIKNMFQSLSVEAKPI